MRLASLAVIVLTALAPATAAADGVYITESFGGTDVKDELSAHLSNAMRIRLAGGVRRKNVAFELWMGIGVNTGSHHHDAAKPLPPNYEITTPDGDYHGGGYQGDAYDDGSTGLVTYGVDVKYLQPLSPNLEAYVRGGLSRGIAYGVDGDAAGRGLGIGAGVQLKGKVPALGFLFWPLFFTGWGPKITAAVFADTSYEFYRLHGASRSTDAQLSHLTVGFAVGNDF